MGTIITKNSATSGSVPSSLIQGELAINVANGRLFYGSGSGNAVKEFGVTSSYALNALSASFAQTASFAPAYLPLTGGTINGDLVVNGTASIAFLNVTYESASVIYSSGSNQFGDASNDTQTLWGTVDIKTGPVLVTGSILMSGSSFISGVDYIDFDTGSAVPAWKSGRVYWDNTDGALAVYNAEQDITLQVGQENWTRVSNRTGTTVTNGTVVRIMGAHGDVPEIERAQSLAVSGSVNVLNQILGVATHDIEDGSIGYVTTQGLVRGLNTNAFNDGDTLFVGTGSSGILQNTPPRAPFEIIPVGVCVKASPGGSGIIYVAVQEPIDFSDLSSIEVSGSYNYGDLWTYVPSGSYGVWRHTNQLSGSYGLTGSLTATSFTGSLQGTASFANNATTASYVLNAVSASFATTAQTATTASYVLNAVSASFASTASFVPTIKASSASIASFVGSPYSASITFGTAYSNNLYSVTVTGEDSRAWSISGKTSTGFTINSNSSVLLSGPVYWIATPFNS